MPLSGSLTFQDQDNLLRGPADAGEGPRRRRFSAVSRLLNFTMVMSATQLATLQTFYKTTLGGGVSRFTYVDPVSGDAKEFAFAEPYQVQDMGGVDCFRVSLALIRKVE
jgi:hypothetical protein